MKLRKHWKPPQWAKKVRTIRIMPLLKVFIEICLFRKGPQDLPESDFLLGLTLFMNVLASVFLASLEVELTRALLQSLMAPAILALFIYGLLALFRRGNRCKQTLTAAVACDALITGLAIPLVFVSLVFPGMRTEAGLLLFGLMLWGTAVIGHIVRVALETPYMTGLVLALAYTVVSYRIMMALFPPML